MSDHELEVLRRIAEYVKSFDASKRPAGLDVLLSKWQRLQASASKNPALAELTFIKSYLAHNDQDANHAWMARRINAVLAGGDPDKVPGWAESDGVRKPRRVEPGAKVSAVKTDLGYRIAIPHAWGAYVTITDDEARELAVAIIAASIEHEAPWAKLKGRLPADEQRTDSATDPKR